MTQALPHPEPCPGKNSARSLTGACLLGFLLAVGMGLFPACGKKGPPFLPEKTMEATVERLTGTWADGKIRLEGTIAGGSGGQDITGCTIYQAWYPADELPCEGCPVPLTKHAGDVDLSVSEDRFQCAFPVAENHGAWFIEVRLTGRNGAVGSPSERVRIDAAKRSSPKHTKAQRSF